MKRWMLLMSLLIGLVGCAPGVTPVPPPSLAETPFSSAELGFSMRYPQGWVVEEGETPGVITFLDSRVKPGADSLPAMPVSVAVLSGPRAGLGLPQGNITSPGVLNPLLQLLGVGMKIEAAAPVAGTLAGKPAARVEVSGVLNVGTELVGRVAAVDLGNKVWAAFALAPKGEWQAFEPYFEQMMGSVVFK